MVSNEGIPQAIDAERAVIAAIVWSTAAAREAITLVGPEDFYRPQHELVFATVAQLLDEGLTIDPQLVLTRLTERGLVRKVGDVLSNAITDQSSTATNVGYHCQRVAKTAKIRRWQAVGAKIQQQTAQFAAGYTDGKGDDTDVDRTLDGLARLLIDQEIMLEERDFNAPIEGLRTWDEFLAMPDRAHDWLCPDLFERQDIWMILATEGGGKSWFSRQMCLALARGVHPFRPREVQFPPVPTLLIDLENSESMLRRQSRVVNTAVVRLGNQPSAPAWVWQNHAGLDVRKRRDAMMLERAVRDSGARFVALGSLYNAFRKGSDDWETAAEEVVDVFNRIRDRYGVTWLVEHHMPKATSALAERSATPYGSSVWARWATMGRVIKQRADNVYQLEDSFRNDRDPRIGMPVGLTRGGDLPWSPIWSRDDLDAAIENATADPRTGEPPNPHVPQRGRGRRA